MSAPTGTKILRFFEPSLRDGSDATSIASPAYNFDQDDIADLRLSSGDYPKFYLVARYRLPVGVTATVNMRFKMPDDIDLVYQSAVIPSTSGVITDGVIELTRQPRTPADPPFENQTPDPLLSAVQSSSTQLRFYEAKFVTSYVSPLIAPETETVSPLAGSAADVAGSTAPTETETVTVGGPAISTVAGPYGVMPYLYAYPVDDDNDYRDGSDATFGAGEGSVIWDTGTHASRPTRKYRVNAPPKAVLRYRSALPCYGRFEIWASPSNLIAYVDIFLAAAATFTTVTVPLHLTQAHTSNGTPVVVADGDEVVVAALQLTADVSEMALLWLNEPTERETVTVGGAALPTLSATTVATETESVATGGALVGGYAATYSMVMPSPDQVYLDTGTDSATKMRDSSDATFVTAYYVELDYPTALSPSPYAKLYRRGAPPQVRVRYRTADPSSTVAVLLSVFDDQDLRTTQQIILPPATTFTTRVVSFSMENTPINASSPGSVSDGDLVQPSDIRVVPYVNSVAVSELGLFWAEPATERETVSTGGTTLPLLSASTIATEVESVVTTSDTSSLSATAVVTESELVLAAAGAGLAAAAVLTEAESVTVGGAHIVVQPPLTQVRVHGTVNTLGSPASWVSGSATTAVDTNDGDTTGIYISGNTPQINFYLDGIPGFPLDARVVEATLTLVARSTVFEDPGPPPDAGVSVGPWKAQVDLTGTDAPEPMAVPPVTQYAAYSVPLQFQTAGWTATEMRNGTASKAVQIKPVASPPGAAVFVTEIYVDLAYFSPSNNTVYTATEIESVTTTSTLLPSAGAATVATEMEIGTTTNQVPTLIDGVVTLLDGIIFLLENLLFHNLGIDPDHPDHFAAETETVTTAIGGTAATAAVVEGESVVAGGTGQPASAASAVATEIETVVGVGRSLSALAVETETVVATGTLTGALGYAIATAVATEVESVLSSAAPSPAGATAVEVESVTTSTSIGTLSASAVTTEIETVATVASGVAPSSAAAVESEVGTTLNAILGVVSLTNLLAGAAVLESEQLVTAATTTEIQPSLVVAEIETVTALAEAFTAALATETEQVQAVTGLLGGAAASTVAAEIETVAAEPLLPADALADELESVVMGQTYLQDPLAALINEIESAFAEPLDESILDTEALAAEQEVVYAFGSIVVTALAVEAESVLTGTRYTLGSVIAVERETPVALVTIPPRVTVIERETTTADRVHDEFVRVLLKNSAHADRRMDRASRSAAFARSSGSPLMLNTTLRRRS